jgi:hypothetical protein
MGELIVDYDTTDCKFMLRIVDRDYNIITSTDSILPYRNHFFDLKDLNIINDTVRVYYKIINDNCELKGHGDLVILE